MNRALAALVSVAACLAGASVVAIPLGATYVAIDLGSLGEYSQATAINSYGQVAGNGRPAGTSVTHAFSWTKFTGMVDLGTLGGPSSVAIGVDDLGEVVGNSETADGSFHAFVWTEETGMVDLFPTLAGDFSPARDVNARGVVVGQSSVPGEGFHTFFWRRTRGLTEIDPFFPVAVNGIGQAAGGERQAVFWTRARGIVLLGTAGFNWSSATALSDRGQVVGYLSGRGQQLEVEHAFSWTETGGLLDIGTLGGQLGRAVAVNNGGLVVGQSSTALGHPHAFSWSAETGMIDLHVLGPPPDPHGLESAALDVNEHGQIVGWSHRFTTAQPPFVGREQRAVLWSGGMRDLGTLGGHESSAVAINDRGLIVGWSTTADNSYRATLWVPVN